MQKKLLVRALRTQTGSRRERQERAYGNQKSIPHKIHIG
jgi:hypothetical protein